MARYKGSVVKKARNLGGTLDGYPKTENLRRAYPGGQHGQARKKRSEYALQLREKQKVRFTYGVSEKQFRSRYYEGAVRKKGVTGTLMLQFLEMRFDSVLFRSGLAHSRPQARQFIGHGHFLVNGKKVDIPSYTIKPGDVIGVREKSQGFIRANLEGRNPFVPHWIETNLGELSATVKAVPEREDIDPEIKENLIIEYYSR